SIDSTQTAVRYGQGSLGLPSPGTGTGTFRSNGSADMVTTGGVPGFDNSAPLGVSVLFRITANIGMLADHWLVSATDPPPLNSPATCPATTPSLPNYWCTGWFVRNEWYRLVYYATASGHTAAALPALPSCTSGVNCLSVTNITPANKQRSILILAGRSLTNPAGRPNGTLSDYLEFGNADLNTVFEQQPISTVINPALKKPFNDRIIVLDANP
ncbi:MAG TPA: hypothetical protein VK572_04730, partial [Burkholderiales bacterium]|nr:hypothetical protein [Burkholderiales bacterium]